MPSSSKKNKSASNLPWVHQAGVVAWATKQSTATCKASWVNRWPVLLYPSWSTAVHSSGLLSQDDDSHTIRIQFYNRPVAIQPLGENLVPGKVALGPALEEMNGKRGKVVAYFLGRPPSCWEHLNPVKNDSAENTVAQWAAITVDSLVLYNIASCKDVLNSCFSTTTMNQTCTCCMSPSFHHDRLIHAMKEVSIVCQCVELDPKVIAPSLLPQNTTTDSATTGVTDTRSVHRKTIDNTTAPEFFDEWRAGHSLNTQKFDTQNESQFSQGLGSIPITTHNDEPNEDGKKIEIAPLLSHSALLSLTHTDHISTTPEKKSSVYSSSSILSDDTPITSNVSQSQIHAASVLLNLNARCFVSPNKSTIRHPSQRENEKALSVTFDMNHVQDPLNIIPTPFHNHQDNTESMDDVSTDMPLNKRRKLPSENDLDPPVSSCCSLQSLASLPIVTPKTDVKKSKELELDAKGSEETEDDESEQFLSYESSTSILPLFTQ